MSLPPQRGSVAVCESQVNPREKRTRPCVCRQPSTRFDLLSCRSLALFFCICLLSAAARRPASTANRGTLNELVSSIRTQPDFSRMVGYSIECIKKLAVDEVAIEEIIDSGAIQAIEAALARHPNNEKLHTEYMVALQNFSRNPYLASKIGEACGKNFTKFAHSLRTHTDINTHIATAKAIAALSQDESNMDALADQGVLDALTEAVKQNPNNMELLASAAKSFSKFAAYKPEFADFIARSGATEVIIAGMRANPTDRDLALGGSEMLSVISGTSEENRQLLKKMGAVEALLGALEAHPSEKALEVFAGDTLARLTGEDDMLRALSVCTGNTAVDHLTAHSLSTVASLLLVADNVETMFRHAGVEWLINIIGTEESRLVESGAVLTTGDRVLEHGMRALMRSATDPNHVYDVIRNGGVQLCVSLLHRHTELSVLSAALGAISQLVCGSEDNAIYLVSHGGISGMLRAYASFPNEVGIVRSTLDMMLAVTAFESVAESLLQAGAIEALIDVMRRHIDTADVAMDVLSCIGRLGTSEENVRRMVQAGMVPLLLDLLKRHAGDENVARTAVLALELLALLPENIESLLARGGVEIVHAIMAQHPDNGEIQMICGRVLDLLMHEQKEEMARARIAAQERAQLEELERVRLVKEAEAEQLRVEEAARVVMEQEMAEALTRLKEQDVKEEVERKRQEQYQWEENIRLRAVREKEAREAKEYARLSALVAPTKVAAPAKPAVRSVRALFEADAAAELADGDAPPLFELEPAVRQFLLAGQMLTKHSKTALPATKHVYLSHDLKHLIWNKPMTEILAKNTLLVTDIHGVTQGRTTPQLQRVRFGQNLAGPSEHCFSISGASFDGSLRTIDLECKTASECDKWAHAIGQLARWVKTRKLVRTHTPRGRETSARHAGS